MKLPTPDYEALNAAVRARFPDATFQQSVSGGLTMTVKGSRLTEILLILRDDEVFAFEQLIDLCGVDYSTFAAGYEGLFTQDAMTGSMAAANWAGERYAVVYHLLSLRRNQRLRVRCFLADEELPVCPTATGVWPAANWLEREAFDLYGIAFDGHPDLRRILTDYGFIGHPFRKDFPVYGHTEMRFDPAKGRVVYQPVTISPREVVPRIRRTGSFGSGGKRG